MKNIIYKLKISEKNAQNLNKILVKKLHETKIANQNNEFHFNNFENIML